MPRIIDGKTKFGDLLVIGILHQEKETCKDKQARVKKRDRLAEDSRQVATQTAVANFFPGNEDIPPTINPAHPAEGTNLFDPRPHPILRAYAT